MYVVQILRPCTFPQQLSRSFKYNTFSTYKIKSNRRKSNLDILVSSTYNSDVHLKEFRTAKMKVHLVALLSQLLWLVVVRAELSLEECRSFDLKITKHQTKARRVANEIRIQALGDIGESRLDAQMASYVFEYCELERSKLSFVKEYEHKLFEQDAPYTLDLGGESASILKRQRDLVEIQGRECLKTLKRFFARNTIPDEYKAKMFEVVRELNSILQ